MATIITADGGNISSDRYVEITSGVGGAAAFGTRQLTPRLFTTNELFPTNSIVKFSSASDLLNYLNQDSTADEYKQGSFLFSYVSKSIRTVKSIEIARWADTDTWAQVFGAESASVTTLTAYSAANLAVTLDGSEFAATIDFSAYTTYAEMATELQTKIAALDASLSSTTVVFNPLTGGFDLDTNGTADGRIGFSSSTSGFLTDVGFDATAIFSDGIAAQSLTSVMTTSTNLSNNFGTFSFIDNLTSDQIVEIATWNSAQNFMFMFSFKSLKSDAAANYAAVKTFGGVSMTLYDSENYELPWLHMMAEAGAVDPSKANAFPNFMFGKNSLVTPMITTDSEADTYDAYRANYFGRTQESGNTVVWYQRGVLMGGDTDATDMSVYLGEMWLKSELKSQFLNMFNALPGVTPDILGRSVIKSYLDSTIEKALPVGGNGVISIGKDLTTTQKAYIGQITGDDNAWQSVRNDGYWYDIDFSSEVSGSGVTEWTANYTLIYAKSDKIRKVVGTNILI